CNTNRSQVRTEADTLRRFFDLADATGLSLPEDSQALRALIHEMQTEDYTGKLDAGAEVWPPRQLWSLLGIAQHYGVPTRLLDWSHKALTAAYFAAHGAFTRLSAAAAETHKIFGIPPPEALLSIAWKLKLDDPAARTDPVRAEKAAAWENYQALERKKMTVWAFAYGKYASWFDGWYARSRSAPIPPLQIAKVTAPHAQNTNLHAQDGLFT